VRVALAHDYLTQRGGAERVALTLHQAFPESPLYTTLHNPETTYPEFAHADLRLSPLNRVAAFRRDHRLALPFLGAAVEGLVVRDADVALASTTAFMHGITTGDIPLVVYCHSPARFIYLLDEYLGRPAHASPMGLGLLAARPYLRWWDQRAARRATRYLCNSRVVAERIQRVYGFDAVVIPPPHAISADAAQTTPEAVADWADGYHLVVSRLLPYKNVHTVVDAFRGVDERLVIVGKGPMEAEIRASLPPNVRLLSGISDAELRWVYAHATALIAASYEDFGLAPLESASFGVPTLALRAGGFLDTIDESVNGAFFATVDAATVRDAVVSNRSATWDATAIRHYADGFTPSRFVDRITEQLRLAIG
jgi:glycosyltransferase involved in cell wall biosynthesis